MDKSGQPRGVTEACSKVHDIFLLRSFLGFRDTGYLEMVSLILRIHHTKYKIPKATTEANHIGTETFQRNKNKQIKTVPIEQQRCLQRVGYCINDKGLGYISVKET